MANNTTNRGFIKAWDMLPAGKQAEIKKEIMEKCDWSSPTTFYSRLNGESEMRKPEMLVLDMIFRFWNINVETGEYIKQLA